MNIIPCHIYDNFKRGKNNGSFEGGVLFVDIGDFTSLTEKMGDYGKEGAEYLSKILNDNIFSNLIDIVHRYNGFITTFAGDAFTAVFTDAEKGYECSSFIKKSLTVFKVDTPWGKEKIYIKGGFACGEINWAIVGENSMLSYYYKGYPIDRSAQLEKKCEKGEIKIEFDKSCKNQSLDFKFKNIKSNKAISYFNDVIRYSYGGEFRNVASVFISVADSIGKNEELLSSFVYDIKEWIKDYKGYFNLLEFGDKGCKIFGMFGAPVSYGDNLFNALNFSYTVKEKYKNDVRIGISYGRVFAGIVGSKKRYTYTAIGDSVNISARLMSKAKWGDILVSDNIYDKYKGKSNFEKVGHLRLKGKKDEIGAWKFDGIKTNVNFSNIPLIGRDDELDEIENYLSEKIKDKGNLGVILVKGGQGVGKSALFNSVEEKFGNSVYFIKVNAMTAEGSRIFRNIVLNIFGELSQREDVFEDRWNEFVEYAKNENLMFAYPFIKYMLTGKGDKFIENADPLHLKESIKFSVKEVLKGASNIFPFIVFVDNVSALDEEFREWINMVFREVEEFRFGFFITTRDKDFDISSDLSVLLKDLKDADIKNIVKYFFKENVDAIYEFIKKRCGGNPLYIVETLMYLKDKYDNSIASFKDIPSKLEDIIISRVDRFDNNMKKFIYYAASLGYEFRKDILDKIFKEDTNKFINMGIKNNLWGICKNDIFQFNQSLIRDVVYGVLMPSSLKKIHYKIAKVMKDMYVNDSSFYYEIGKHYQFAKMFKTSANFYKKSLDYALKNYYMKEALEIVDRLIEITKDEKYYLKKAEIMSDMSMWNDVLYFSDKYLNKLNLKNRVKLKLILVDIYSKKGEYEKALDIIKDISQNINYGTKDHSKIVLLRGMINLAKGEFEEAKRNYTVSYNYAKRKNDKKIQAVCLNNLSLILWDKGELNDSIKSFEETIKLAEEINDKYTVLSSFNNLGGLYYVKKEFDKSLEYYKKAAEIAKQVFDFRGEAIAYGNMGNCYYMKGDYDRAIIHYEKRLEKARELGDIKGALYAKNNIGSVYYIKGDKERACKIYKELFEESLKRDILYIEKISLINVISLTFEKGLFNECMEYIEKLRKIGKKKNNDEMVNISYIREMRLCLFEENYGGAVKLSNKLSNNLKKNLFIEGKLYEYISRRFLGEEVNYSVFDDIISNNDVLFFLVYLLRMDRNVENYELFLNKIDKKSFYYELVENVMNNRIDVIKRVYEREKDIWKKAEYGIELYFNGILRKDEVVEHIKKAEKIDKRFFLYYRLIDKVDNHKKKC